MVTGPKRDEFLENLQALEEQRSVCVDRASRVKVLEEKVKVLNGEGSKDLQARLFEAQEAYNDALRELNRLNAVFKRGPKLKARKKSDGTT